MSEWKKLYVENRKYLFMVVISFIILMLAGVVHADCEENWIQNDTECSGYNYTIEWYDGNNCNTTNFLPISNGTIIDCQCYPSWSQNINGCSGGVTLIEYTDLNNCNVSTSIPSNNNTYEYCVIYEQREYATDIIILAVLFLFLIVSTIMAISVHEAFFGLNALLIGLMIIVFIQYSYPTILIYASVICILAFTIMWVIIGKNKR